MNGHWIQTNPHEIQINGQWIQMNGNQNQKQIGQNNHLQTQFRTHSYILSNQKQISQNNHLQTLFHTHCYILSNWKGIHQNPITSQHYITLSKNVQAIPSQECKRVWDRKKDGQALTSHFSGSSKLRVSFLVSIKKLMELYPPNSASMIQNVILWTVISVLVVEYQGLLSLNDFLPFLSDYETPENKSVAIVVDLNSISILLAIIWPRRNVPFIRSWTYLNHFDVSDVLELLVKTLVKINLFFELIQRWILFFQSFFVFFLLKQKKFSLSKVGFWKFNKFNNLSYL